jgi:hypothetical protein
MHDHIHIIENICWCTYKIILQANSIRNVVFEQVRMTDQSCRSCEISENMFLNQILKHAHEERNWTPRTSRNVPKTRKEIANKMELENGYLKSMGKYQYRYRFLITIITLDIIHHPVFYLKHKVSRLDSVSVFRWRQNPVSETLCF